MPSPPRLRSAESCDAPRLGAVQRSVCARTSAAHVSSRPDTNGGSAGPLGRLRSLQADPNAARAKMNAPPVRTRPGVWYVNEVLVAPPHWGFDGPPRRSFSRSWCACPPDDNMAVLQPFVGGCGGEAGLRNGGEWARLPPGATCQIG